MQRLIKRFLRDKSGNFAIMTALAMVPLIAAAGVAMDVSQAVSIRTELYAAADAAAIGVVSDNSAATKAAFAQTADGPVAIGATEAVQIFKAQLPAELKNLTVTATATVTKKNNALNSVVNFSVQYPTTLTRIINKAVIPIAGQATASIALAPYIDFYLLLDNSPSMGVAATTTDIAKLQTLTVTTTYPSGCAFACHDLSGASDFYTIAKDNNVNMRIDVVRSAVKALTTYAPTKAVYSNQFKMGIYSFGKTVETAGLTTVLSPTSNLTTVASTADDITKIDLMTIKKNNSNNDEGTNFDSNLTSMLSIIPTPGDGSTSASPQKVLFFVTDGVGDLNKPNTCTEPTTSGRCQEPIDTTFCQPLKNKGVKIAILYTTYLPQPYDGWYNTWIAPFQTQIGPRLQSCASPGLYFEVSFTQGISDAMNALFLQVLRQTRLTS